MNASRQRIVTRLLENNMIKIKLATPFFFFGRGGERGWRQIILQKGGQQIHSIAYVPFCSVLHYLAHGCHERGDR